MGGGFHRCLRYLTALLIVAASGFLYPPKTQAGVAFLEAPYDHTTSLTPGQELVMHEVGFVLPAGSAQIQPNDWVLVDAPSFTNLSPFTDIIGGFGNPVFDTRGTQFRATHLVLLPGTSLILIGGTATNPLSTSNYQITIKIAKGRADGPISNSATFSMNSSGAYVVMSATVTSPLSAVTIQGFTGPNDFVNLTEGGSVEGTTSAQADGSFYFYLTALDPGDHTFSIAASDRYGLSTTQATVELHLLGGTSTTASGIILSSTIQSDKDSINPGDALTLSGTAKPDSQINIFTESPLRSYTATTGSDGLWSYVLPSAETKGYSPGQYRAYTVVQDDIGNQSLNSPTVNFTVLSPANADNPAPACDISHGDLNCNGKTNLTDFSILLFHWGTNHKLADINSDGKVNLTDFSIMMFYFQF